jgi:hypothetical protein
MKILKGMKWGMIACVAIFILGLLSQKSSADAPLAPSVLAENISISGATGNGGVYITQNAQNGGNSDVMKVEWNNSVSGDNNSGITGVTVDFSQLEGGSAAQAFDDGGVAPDSCDNTAGDGIWTACYSLSRGTFNGVIGKISVSATNDLGVLTRTQDDANITIDNVPPVVETTVETYSTDTASFSFSGKTSAGSKVYYEIYDDNGLVSSDYVGQAADVNGDYIISGIDISSMADGIFYLNVWVQDSAGNFSAGYYDNKNFSKSGNIIGMDKTLLTAAVNDEYTSSAREAYRFISTNYTLASWTYYVDAITAAIAVEENVSATPSDISEAISAIVVSKDNLVVAVTDMVIKNPPTKVAYTEGDSLDLSGLVVTITDGDNHQSDVALADFASVGISTVKANGASLVVADTSVAITANDITATQPISVNAMPPAATPTANIAGGTYDSFLNITLSSASQGSVVHYTTDGSAPTDQSTVFIDPILVVGDTTIKALAIVPGTPSMPYSDIMTQSYVLKAATPTANIAGGTYNSAQGITLASASQGSVVHYTTDGSAPTAQSTEYSGPILVLVNTTIKALAIVPGTPGMAYSDIMTQSYVLNAAKPTATPAGGTYFSSQEVALSTITSGAAIYYTIDGSTPGLSCTQPGPGQVCSMANGTNLYSSPIVVGHPENLKAIAIKAGMANSVVMSETYNIITGTIVDSFTATGFQRDLTGGLISINGQNPLVTDKITFNVNYSLVSNQTSITIPPGTEIVRTGGGAMDLTTISNQNVTAEINSAASGYDVPGAIRFGIPNMNLTFSKPVTISMQLGSGYDGKNLNVYSRNESATDWSIHTTCSVASGVCVFQTGHATFFAAGENAPGTLATVSAVVSSSEEDNKVLEPTKRDIRNSKTRLAKGDTLIQSGKRFSKNSEVKLYFARYGGGYYEPMTVKTSKSGVFSVSYKVNKHAGTYGWYALDVKTSRKSRTMYYHVK